MQPVAQAPGIVSQFRGWINARKSGQDLFVYRSVELLDSDSLYQPVAKILERPHTVCLSGFIDDESMMFGQAEWVWYRLGEV